MKAVAKLTCALVLAGGALAPAAELAVGDPAPDFKLQASDGKTYTLSQFKGKKAVVLAWFPKAFTSGCTVECKSLAANGEKLRQFDVAYFMASVDTPEDNKAFAEKEHADFPILADPGKKTATAYGVVTDQRPVAFRWTFYIGPDGKIAAIDKKVNPATSGEDVVAKLKELNVAERP